MPDPLGLTANLPTETALAAILAACGQDFDQHLASFLESPDPDGPRKARVALRRLTTALDAFAPVLRKSRARDLRRRAKTLFRLLGQIRDADVVGQTVPEAAVAESLRDSVRRHLRKARAPTFGVKLQTQATLDHLLRSGKPARRLRHAPLVQTASSALALARARCLKDGTDLSRLSDRKTHDLRKGLKSWRYLAEFFAPCWPDDQDAQARRQSFQALQDALGVLTDQALLRRAGVEVDRQAAEAALVRAQDLLCARVLEDPWWQDRPKRARE